MIPEYSASYSTEYLLGKYSQGNVYFLIQGNPIERMFEVEVSEDSSTAFFNDWIYSPSFVNAGIAIGYGFGNTPWAFTLQRQYDDARIAFNISYEKLDYGISFSKTINLGQTYTQVAIQDYDCECDNEDRYIRFGIKTSFDWRNLTLGISRTDRNIYDNFVSFDIGNWSSQFLFYKYEKKEEEGEIKLESFKIQRSFDSLPFDLTYIYDEDQDHIEGVIPMKITLGFTHFF